MNIDYSRLRDEALVDTAWLAANLTREGQCVVDMRKGDGYNAAHIPEAVTHPGSSFLREAGDVISAAAFSAFMRGIGVGPDTTIIAYDDGNGLFAARLWWVARYYGHERIKVLDGGWDAWLAEGRATSAAVPTPRSGAFIAQVRPELIASTAYVAAALGRTDVCLLDVRGDEEWRRTESDAGATAGHVPGARHLVWSEVIDRASMRFRAGETLRRMFLGAGVVPGVEIIPYCQGGIRAAHAMLALHLAGLGPARNYEGSWAAWSKSDLPIEVHDADPRSGTP